MAENNNRDVHLSALATDASPYIGTKAQWDATTRACPDGILMRESDTDGFKIADGVHLYKDIPYAKWIPHSIQHAIVFAQKRIAFMRLSWIHGDQCAFIQANSAGTILKISRPFSSNESIWEYDQYEIDEDDVLATDWVNARRHPLIEKYLDRKLSKEG